ncbi:hypothetical protein FRC03_002878 [Tulasnella sp. 419]|nr:hypothetical protein FRC03_002878 [Tulasnella sp. 419]
MDTKSTRLSRLWGGKSNSNLQATTSSTTHHTTDDESDVPPAPPPKDNSYNSFHKNSPYGNHHNPSSTSLLTTTGSSRWHNLVGQAQEFGSRLISPAASQVSLAVPPGGTPPHGQAGPSTSPQPKSKFKLPLLRRKPSKTPSIATDDSGDSSISTPWNFKHDLHVDETYAGLPPEWSNALEAAGYSHQEIHAIYARSISLPSQASSSTSMSPPGAVVPTPRGDSLRKTPSPLPLPDKALPDPQGAPTRSYTAPTGLPSSPAPPVKRSPPHRVPAPPIPPDTASKRHIANNGIPLSPPPKYTSPESTPIKLKPSLDELTTNRGASNKRTSSQQPSFWDEDDDDDDDDDRRRTLKPQDSQAFAMAARSMKTKASEREPDAEDSSGSEVETDTLGPLKTSKSVTMPPRLSLTLADGTRLSSTAPMLSLGLGLGGSDSSSSGFGLDLDDWSKDLLNIIPRGDEDSSRSATSTFSSSLSTSTSNSTSPTTPTKAKSLPLPPTSPSPSTSSSSKTVDTSSSRTPPPPIAKDKLTVKPPIISSSVTASPISISPSAPLPSVAPSVPSPSLPSPIPSPVSPAPVITPPKRQQSLSAASRLAHSKATSSSTADATSTRPIPTRTHTNPLPSVGRVSPSAPPASCTSPLLPSPKITNEPSRPTPPPKEDPRPATAPESQPPASTAPPTNPKPRFAPVPIVPLHISPKKKNSPTTSSPSSVRTKRMSTSLSGSNGLGYPVRSLSVLISEVNGGGPLVIPVPPEETKEEDEDDDDEEDGGLLPYLRPNSADGEKTPTTNTKTLSFPSPPSTIPSKPDGRPSDRYSARSSGATTITAVEHLQYAQKSMAVLKPVGAMLVRPASVAQTLNGSGSSDEGDPDMDVGDVLDDWLQAEAESEVDPEDDAQEVSADVTVKLPDTAKPLEKWVKQHQQTVGNKAGVYWMESVSEIWLEMELMERSLADVLAFVQEQQEEGDMQWVLEERMIARFANDILSGLDYLQGLNVAHRDVRSDNLLFSKSGALKLADFSNATLTSATNSKRTSVSGQPPYWMAPEMRKGLPYDPHEADIWSTGATVWEVCKGDPPFIEIEDPSFFKDFYPPLEDGSGSRKWSKELKSFLRFCESESGKRPRAVELLRVSCPHFVAARGLY